MVVAGQRGGFGHSFVPEVAAFGTIPGREAHVVARGRQGRFAGEQGRPGEAIGDVAKYLTTEIRYSRRPLGPWRVH